MPNEKRLERYEERVLTPKALAAREVLKMAGKELPADEPSQEIDLF